MIQQRDNPIVETPTLHEFWKDFGEFPPYYFVRKEEVVFWKVIKKLKLTIEQRRIVIVGSPGVEKSCFLMLIAFYLACIKKRRVLVIRRSKKRFLKNAVEYFNGQGCYARLTNLAPNEINAIRRQVEGAFVLVDGYDQKDGEMDNELEPFHFLATSGQYDAKHNDSARVVVLPAWRDTDLLQYAKLTNRATETDLRTIERYDTPIAKLVKEQYL
ncbi:hypothetical protein GN244_ATG02270 [Phytophthora infestans]|uniref:Crinkler (CRN) family protein n=1 Tax=Phytophthora infestans TaxID=4787 RepID=A0A833TF26_PHYIN|nr:hypothetical protein GN244_ATG02270 [Phytophthora infestans]KAF4130953.1 hypothetical protein GN958_ATG19846 [Phytophthora infestans]